MAKLEISTVIDRPLEEVIAFTLNFEHQPKWQSRLLEANKTSEGPNTILEKEKTMNTRKAFTHLVKLSRLLALLILLLGASTPAYAQTVVATVAVGDFPTGVAVNEKTNRIYVANAGSDTVSVIDGATNTMISTIAVGDGPFGVAVNEKTNRIYVANAGSDTVSVIDGATDTMITTIPVGIGPTGVAVNEKTNRIYVTNLLSDTVSVIQD